MRRARWARRCHPPELLGIAEPGEEGGERSGSVEIDEPPRQATQRTDRAHAVGDLGGRTHLGLGPPAGDGEDAVDELCRRVAAMAAQVADLRGEGGQALADPW